ncbi:amidohydrolase family protein [Hyphococcus formosus]|uniref:amidohydrolase family protein n=1 Tax=Hyphococcus formosus TaxID=3143534 RepID=UPI00398A9425
MNTKPSSEQRSSVDTVISGATIITMNESRQIIRDGAIAVKDGLIVAVGKTDEITAAFDAKEQVDGRNFVITPGFVDGHVHITGDPLTQGVRRGAPGEDFTDVLTKWVIPLFHAHEPHDEKISAQCSAMRMLHSGVTSFVEAGTIRHLNAVAEGVASTGVRGRIGGWVEGRNFAANETDTVTIDEAIATLEAQVEKYKQTDSSRVAAWPLLIGHTVNPDEVWLAAKRLADENGLCISAHMSPHQSDPDWFLENTGKRPIEHLADIGVLGDNVMITHAAYVNEREVEIFADTKTNVIFCPHAALKGAFGVTKIGLFPEMAEAGVNIMLGTDGVFVDLLTCARLMTGLFKDARIDEHVFPATEVLEMVTLNGARGMNMQSSLGAIEPGMKADIVCFDTDRPEWFPEFDVVEQILQANAGIGAHSVWVEGERVIENYRSTKIDEDELFAEIRKSSQAIVDRAGIKVHSPWPVI